MRVVRIAAISPAIAVWAKVLLAQKDPTMNYKVVPQFVS